VKESVCQEKWQTADEFLRPIMDGAAVVRENHESIWKAICAAWKWDTLCGANEGDSNMKSLKYVRLATTYAKLNRLRHCVTVKIAIDVDITFLLELINWIATWSLADVSWDILCNNAVQCLISVSGHTHSAIRNQNYKCQPYLGGWLLFIRQCGIGGWICDCVNRPSGCIKHG
jgi:hypothetical protein